MTEERSVIVVEVDVEHLQEELRKWDQLPSKRSTQMKGSQFIETRFERVDNLRCKKYSWDEISDLIKKSLHTEIAP